MQAAEQFAFIACNTSREQAQEQLTFWWRNRSKRYEEMAAFLHQFVAGCGIDVYYDTDFSDNKYWFVADQNGHIQATETEIEALAIGYEKAIEGWSKDQHEICDFIVSQIEVFMGADEGSEEVANG